MWCFAVTWFFLTLRQTILWCWKARIQSLCNRIAPHQSASFPRRVKNKSERKTRVYLLGVKANLCLHNSQYSFLLCFSHCTKLGKQRKKDRTQWEWPHGVKQMLLAFPPPLLPLDTAGPRDRHITANRGDDSCTAGRFYGLLQFIKKVLIYYTSMPG